MTPPSSRPAGLSHPDPPPGLSADGVIRWFARRQHGVASRQQLLVAGITGRQIDERVSRGAIGRVHRGVISVDASPLGPRGLMMAALLAGPADAVVSHRTAAELRGMLPERRGPIHVTSAGTLHARSGIVMHSSTSHARTATVVDGIPCTALPRTLVDVCANDGPVAADRAWTTLAGRGALRPRAIEAELRRSRGRPGVAGIRRLLEHHRAAILGTTRSSLEDDALAMCAAHGLPMPRLNALVETDDGVYAADMLWEAPRVVVELDDWTTHGHVRAFHVDRDRDFDLDLTGWRTVRLVGRDVTVDARRTASRLARFFETRLTELGRSW